MKDQNEKPGIKIGKVADNIYIVYDTFLTQNKHAKVIETLWTISTYVYEQFETTPYIAIVSPEEASGKSQVPYIASLMVRNPVKAGSVTESSFMRLIEKKQPTILYDEADADLGGKNKADKLQGIVTIFNNGFQEDGVAYISVPTKDGKVGDWTPKAFNLYCPKMWISNSRYTFPKTTRSRSIIIPMFRQTLSERNARRKAKQNNVRRNRKRFLPMIESIKADCEVWRTETDCASDDNEVELPEKLQDKINDRTIDYCEPLVKIADECGGSWPEDLANAIEHFCTTETVALEVHTRLLNDIHIILQAEPRDSHTDGLCHDGDFISTKDLIKHLCQEQFHESKWNEFNFGKNIHAKTLAGYLQNYEIKSVHKATGNGYLVSTFVDPVKRYILEHVKPSMDKSFLQPFSIGTYKMNSVKDIQDYRHDFDTSSIDPEFADQTSEQEVFDFDEDLEQADQSFSTNEEQRFNQEEHRR